MRNKRRKIKNRKRIVKELEVIRRRFIISILLIIAIILISIIIKNIVTGEEGTEPPAISENVSMVKSSDEIWVPVPKGYSASEIPGETSVNGGFVIYEGENIDWSFLENNTDVSEPVVAEPIISETTEIDSSLQDENSISNNNEANILDEYVNIEDTNLEKNEISNTVEDIDTKEANTDINLETDNKEMIVTSAEKNEYMASEVLDESEELKSDDTNNESVEKQNDLEQNASETNLENKNEISDEENTIENNEENLDNDTNLDEDPIIDSIPKEEETQDENQNLNPEEDEPSTIADDTEETQEEPSQLEKDIFNLQCSRNQYVWVPVGNISDLYGVDTNGKLWGKLYTFSTSSPNKRANNWTETDGIMNITSLTSYREPDIVTSYDYESNYLKSSLNGITQHEFLQTELEQFFYKTIESIKKYGGFYIGRYETGGLNGTAVVRKMDTNIASQTWYTMYKKCKTLGISNPAVTTSMIWGTLWVETLDWFMKSGAVLNNGTQMTYSLICSNSTAWANYGNSTFDYYSDSNMTVATKAQSSYVRIPAGSTDYTKVNNIYDMAGNVLDWTLEAYSTNGRVFRGGGCSNDSFSASNRGYSYPYNSVIYRRLSCPTFN